MNQIRKNFIYKSEGFNCENCGFENLKGEGFIRNHCSQCLCSIHVDLEVPGDRASDCFGVMTPSAISYNSKKGYMIVHKCIKCAKIIKNKLAPDDNMELVAKISAKGYEE